MKSDERHRLNENELGRVVQTAGNKIERNASMIVTVICGCLLVAAVVVWLGRLSNASSTAAWTLMENAETVDDFGTIAEQEKNTPAGNWARLRVAELNLRSGGDALFSDRELAKSDLARARDGFEQLVSSSSSGPVIRERALWGLAVCLESLSDGDTTKAIAAYQRLLQDFPDSIYKASAEERVAALKTGGATEFYAWFDKLNPKPADIRPNDGKSKGVAEDPAAAASDKAPGSDVESTDETRSSPTDEKKESDSKTPGDSTSIEKEDNPKSIDDKKPSSDDEKK